MYFDSLQAVLQMDGHGPYVWAAYLITLTVLVLMLWLPLRRKSVFERQLQGELRRAAGTQTTKGGPDASSP